MPTRTPGSSRSKAGKKSPPISARAANRGEKQPSAPPSEASASAVRGKGKLVSSKEVFRGKAFWVTRDTVTEPGGYTGVRDVVRHNGSVIVLAVDDAAAADPLILLERQYRHAAERFLYELPAGRIEPGEPPLRAAKRELLEETGFRARTWTRLVRYWASPGFVAETMLTFLASGLTAGDAQPEEDERITLQQLPLSQVLGMIERGEIQDGKTILGVLLFARQVAAKTS